MITKSIVKLIDEAIVPAVALVIGKMLGLLFASYFLSLPFSLKTGQIFWVLPSVQFSNLQDYIIAENYSNLAMFLVAAFGAVIVLVKAHYFHESHIHPQFHSKLISLNLESLVTSSYHLYHAAAIWLIFLWLTIGLMTISTILHVTYSHLTVIAFVVAANLSWVFAIDVEKEIEIART